MERRRFEARSEGQRLRKMLRYKLALWSAGIMTVAGVDEAGMSPLAGPVAAGAVVFRPDIRITGVDDSKKLDAQTRERLADEIRREALHGPLGSLKSRRSTGSISITRACWRCAVLSRDCPVLPNIS